MMHYLIQVVLFQLLFLVVYEVFLKKETFFNYNRLYLLATSIMGFVIPFIQIEAIQQSIPQAYRMQLPAVFIGNNANEAVTATTVALDEIVLMQNSVSSGDLVVGMYLLGMVVSILFFALKLRKLYLLKKNAILIKSKEYEVATLQGSDAAFTFFSTIFLGAKISETQRAAILEHELVHVRQRHSLDLLFFEVLRIFFWFNPMVYLFQNKVKALHEFTADRLVASKDKTNYYQNLLSEVFGTTKISFTNTFYKSSLIKNRIVMLQKSNSKKIVQLKYLLLIPAVSAMLVYTSCSDDKVVTDSDLSAKIADLSAEISSKESLSQQEKEALAAFVYNNYPKDVEGISGDNGNLKFTSKDSPNNDGGNRFKTAGVPFGKLDKAPVYPGCDENATHEENKECFTQKVASFVVNNFPKKELNESGVTGKNRIVVEFTIDEFGYLGDLNVRTNNPFLQTATQHVFTSFPALEPAVHEGKKVAVFYTLPIIVDMNE